VEGKGGRGGRKVSWEEIGVMVGGLVLAVIMAFLLRYYTVKYMGRLAEEEEREVMREEEEEEEQREGGREEEGEALLAGGRGEGRVYGGAGGEGGGKEGGREDREEEWREGREGLGWWSRLRARMV